MNQVVNEPVDVTVKYKGTKLHIKKFKKGQTKYIVSKMGNHWIERIGGNIITHYAIICERQGISGELSHNHILNKWLLVQFDILE